VQGRAHVGKAHVSGASMPANGNFKTTSKERDLSNTRTKFKAHENNNTALSVLYAHALSLAWLNALLVPGVRT
jgi:hypothetical protein